MQLEQNQGNAAAFFRRGKQIRELCTSVPSWKSCSVEFHSEGPKLSTASCKTPSAASQPALLQSVPLEEAGTQFDSTKAGRFQSRDRVVLAVHSWGVLSFGSRTEHQMLAALHGCVSGIPLIKGSSNVCHLALATFGASHYSLRVEEN